jgi:putative DNA primase/helicase
MESNVIAATPDSSGGFERRFIQVNFDKMIDRKGMEYNFQERFKAEMSGILNWALEGYRRLVKRGRFEHTTRSQEATDELLKHRAGLASFLKAGWVAECEDDGTRGVRVDRLFALYNDWCELEDVVPHHKEKSTFARELFTIKREWKPRKRRRWFTGEVRDTFILGIEAAEGELRSADVSEGGSEG